MFDYSSSAHRFCFLRRCRRYSRFLQVVQHTMSLLGTLTELQPELSSVMLSSPGLGPALEFSLLHTPEKLVRTEVSKGVLRMAVSLRKKSKVFN